MRLTNLKPTETEKRMFNYCGLYLIESYEWSMVYAPVHLENQNIEFPKIIENISKELVEWDASVVFDTMGERVRMMSAYDTYGLTLILNRMEELGFK